jgi:hypothetical protein
MHVEKSSRVFLWHGKEINKSGKCLVKWEKVCLPQKAGGLGVLNLREQNKALMIKNLFKFYNKADIPWVNLIWQAYYQNGKLPNPDNCKGSFWWRDCISNHNQFKEIFVCKPAMGTTILCWHDKWCNNEILAVKYPQLYSFAKQRRITLQSAVAYNQEDIYEMFNLPLSMVAVDQCNQLSVMLTNHYHQEELMNDDWSFPGKPGRYPTKKVYLAITKPPTAPAPYKWIWKSCCLPKQKFFFWVLVQDRLNTKELMRRKNFFVESKYCVLCDEQIEESMFHLFFSCDFSQNFWWKLGEEWNVELDIMDMIIDARDRSQNTFFKEIMISGC